MLPDRSTDLVFDLEAEPSLTQQQFQRECDINYIVKQNEATGLITHVNNRPGNFGDFSNNLDYQDALNRVAEAQASFMALPADVRARFQNDPAELLAFVSDPRNADEAIKLGIVNPITPTPAPAEKPISAPSEGAQA